MPDRPRDRIVNHRRGRKLTEPMATLARHLGRTLAAPKIVPGTRISPRRSWIAGPPPRAWRGLARDNRAVPSVGLVVSGHPSSLNDEYSLTASVRTRLLLTAAFFGAAFAIDLWTGKRYSPFLGSAAIYGSALTLVPTIRPGLVAATVHTSIWTGFNVVRAYADDAQLGIVNQRLASDIERWLFGGGLPSSMLQRHFFNADQIMPRDVVLGLFHASFFVVPHVIAVLAWHRRRDVFSRYQKATALCFTVSLGAFLLLPTAPPWMTDPGHVTRIPHHIMTRAVAGNGVGTSEGPAETFWFEPNAAAALPSVHVAVAVLVFLGLGSGARWVRLAGGVYALAMSVSVVYLGEHFVLDVITGWLVALLAWKLARNAPRGKIARTRARTESWMAGLLDVVTNDWPPRRGRRLRTTAD